jgi:SAM-dependent methyltransferase
MDVEEYRAASRQQWEGSAEGWGRHAEFVDAAGPRPTAWLLDAAEVEPGMTVLELACGPAGVGLAAAERVGPDGTVICSDFAEPMVAVARERAESAGATNLDFRVLDALEIDLPDESVDAVVCRFGYMLMPEPERGIAEALRVLRPGGRLALAVWSSKERNPWLALPMGTVMEHLGAPPPEPGTPGVFALADRERLDGMLGAAGFEDARVEEVERAFRFDSFDHYWTVTTDLAAPLRALLANMGDDDRAAIQDKLRAASAEFADEDGGLPFPAAALGATGRRPT